MGNLAEVPALDASAALTQEVEIDLFQGPFDLLLTLLLRDEVDMLELPLADLIEESVTPGTDERWEIDASSQLILLLAAIADLKGRRMLGDDVEDEPDVDAIAMREAPASVHAKLRAMPTDPQRVHRHDAGDPERCPVWALHQVVTPATEQATLAAGCRSAAIGCLDCKGSLADHIVTQQQPWRERAEALEPKQVHWLVEVGTERARAYARKTLREVREVLSFQPGT